MAIPANVGRTVLQGTGQGSEIWQTGFWWARPDSADMADLAEFKLYTAEIETAVGGFWGTIKTKCSPAFAYNGVKSYWYRGGTGAALVADNPRAAVVGTLAGACSPLDTCCCVSLVSDTAGRRGRGRMYLPRHETCTAATGLFLNSTVDYINALKALWNALLLQTHSIQQRVVSQKDGVARPMTSIRCDQLPDVQRRRENRMARGAIVSANAPF